MARKKLDSLKIYKIVSVIAIIVAIIALARPYLTSTEVVTKLLPISELSTQGYTKVDVQVSSDGNTGTVTIQGNCYQINANTELSQVESIANGQEGKVGFRPDSHDLIKDALDGFDIKVVMVKIVDMQNNTFIGRLVLKQDGKIVSLDSKPSDGIAVAVRYGAPVYIKDDLLKSQGKNIC
ncbi:MAG: bifunctional nuclease family protein [Candidatus Aenigmarchaeota archaeon]|nr:bifunctional nuclease family protein [Candidatus Aenigmarchaeota archaeon]